MPRDRHEHTQTGREGEAKTGSTIKWGNRETQGRGKKWRLRT